ncbi:MAG: hypothetical protein NT062_37150 [Proteobacteria bacterium]|nr:hypothetical protein [Pseudomonadota bacterium]
MVAALLVGAITAWFLGLRLGVIAAVATAAALLIALVVPGMSLAIYVIVIAWCAGLYFFGKKISLITGQKGLIGGPAVSVASWAGQAQAWVRSKLGSDTKKPGAN